MARIVLGIGSSHTPQISMGSAMWATHAKIVDEDLLGLKSATPDTPEWVPDEVSLEKFEEKYRICEENIALLGQMMRDARPDVVLVLGDDHREVFTDECSPSLALYCGDEVWDLPSPPESLGLASIEASDWAYHGDEAVRYRTAGELASHIVGYLQDNGFDPAVVNQLAEGRSLGHAFTFINRRLAPGLNRPILPVWLNAFYGANQPSAKRCFQIGRALRAAVESWPRDERVAIVASGGLSHYMVDERLDRLLLKAIEAKDADHITSVSPDQLRSGSGEIRMWLAGAGACEDLTVTHNVYVPGYRSLAGTGVGLGFLAWA
jgi:3-O-methylgallate 3,4-dioxygenase